MQAHAALVGTFASPLRPVVVFLDDLQWADVASLDLVEFLLGAPDIRGLVIVGAYRDDEVGPAHAVTRMLGRLEASGRPPTRVRPARLDVASAAALVATPVAARPTWPPRSRQRSTSAPSGNPFFLRTLLQQMHDGGLLHRDGTGWRWSADAPGRLGFADNVVDAVLERLVALPPDTARALGVAARMGHRFDTRLLARARWSAPRRRSRRRSERASTRGSCDPRARSGACWPGAEASKSRLAAAQCTIASRRPLSGCCPTARRPPCTCAWRACSFTTRTARRAARRCSTRWSTTEPRSRSWTRRSGPSLRASPWRRARRPFAAPRSTLRCAPASWASGRWEAVTPRSGSACARRPWRSPTRLPSEHDALDGTPRRSSRARRASWPSAAYRALIRAQTRTERFADAIATADAFLVHVGRRTDTRLRIVAVIGKLARVLWGMRRTIARAARRGARGHRSGPHVAVTSVQMAVTTALASVHPGVLPLDMLRGMDDLLTRGVTHDGLYTWTGWAMLVAEALVGPISAGGTASWPSPARSGWARERAGRGSR